MNHTIVLNPKLPSISNLVIGEIENPIGIMVGPTALEFGMLIRIEYDGEVALAPKQTEQGAFYPLPPKKAVERKLTLTWQARTNRIRQVSFDIVEAPAGLRPAVADAREVITQREASELEAAIAESMNCDPKRFAMMLDNISRRFATTSEAVAEFFGAEGFSTADPKELEPIRQRAKELGVSEAELIAGTLMMGAARTVSEREEFEKLRKNPTDGPLADDFVVEVKTSAETPEAVASEELPRPTNGDLITLANTLGTDVEWCKFSVRIIADLWKLEPDVLLRAALANLKRVSSFANLGKDAYERGSLFLSNIAKAHGGTDRTST